MFGIAVIFGLLAVAVSLAHRHERNKLRLLLACKDAHIDKLNADMMTVMAERNRYRETLEAPLPTVEEQIRRMLWDAEGF